MLGGILTAAYRTGIVLPAGVAGDAADAARETLAGAVTVADTLDPATAEALRTAAAHAFDAGVGITAVIGAVLVGIAAVIAATTLKGSRTAHAEH